MNKTRKHIWIHWLVAKTKWNKYLPLEWHTLQQLQTDTRRTFAASWRLWKYWLYRFSKSGFHWQTGWINQPTSRGLLSRCRHWHRCRGWAFEIAIFVIWCCQGVQHWGRRIPLWLTADMTMCWCSSFLQEPIPWHHLKPINDLWKLNEKSKYPKWQIQNQYLQFQINSWWDHVWISWLSSLLACLNFQPLHWLQHEFCSSTSFLEGTLRTIGFWSLSWKEKSIHTSV